jgi:uncharacterized membrane protein
VEDAVVWDKMVANEAYSCFGYGMMNGSYGYGWMIFSWLIGLLIVAGLVVFIIWMFRKIQYENKREGQEYNRNNRRRR